MTQTQVYTMEAFVEEVRDIFASTKDPRSQAQQISRRMQILLDTPGWLEERLNLPPEGGFGRVDLHHDEEYGHPEGGFLLMLRNPAARPGQSAPRPRHDLGWCTAFIAGPSNRPSGAGPIPKRTELRRR